MSGLLFWFQDRFMDCVINAPVVFGLLVIAGAIYLLYLATGIKPIEFIRRQHS